MSKRKREEIADLENPVKAKAEAGTSSKPKIPFAHWFDKQLRAGKVRDYQDEALLVFFKKQGLKNLEDEEKYDAALERF